jgi:hypothetical protein
MSIVTAKFRVASLLAAGGLSAQAASGVGQAKAHALASKACGQPATSQDECTFGAKLPLFLPDFCHAAGALASSMNNAFTGDSLVVG